jgi:hypothetical protein
LSNAKLSVLFPKEEVNVFWTKLKAKRRDKQNENVGNMAGKGFEEQSIIF